MRSLSVLIYIITVLFKWSFMLFSSKGHLKALNLFLLSKIHAYNTVKKLNGNDGFQINAKFDLLNLYCMDHTCTH